MENLRCFAFQHWCIHTIWKHHSLELYPKWNSVSGNISKELNLPCCGWNNISIIDKVRIHNIDFLRSQSVMDRIVFTQVNIGIWTAIRTRTDQVVNINTHYYCKAISGLVCPYHSDVWPASNHLSPVDMMHEIAIFTEYEIDKAMFTVYGVSDNSHLWWHENLAPFT